MRQILWIALGWIACGAWWCPMSWAAQRDADREEVRLQETKRPALSVAEVNQLRSRGWRDRRSGEYRPTVGKTFRPADYQNAVHRGTVELAPACKDVPGSCLSQVPAEARAWRNYSYHTVKIPNGTIIDGEPGGCNFSQIAPVTEAIDRSPGFGRNLTFRNCNLVNVKVYPDWTIEDCNTAQIDRIGTITGTEENPDITDDVYLANHPDNVNALRVKPVGALE